MADSDPISDGTPRKRVKLDNGNGTSQGRPWDSQEDEGENFTAEDFHTEPTMLMANGAQKRKMPTYTADAFHRDFSSTTKASSGQQRAPGMRETPGQSSQTVGSAFVTQPTQPLAQKSSTPSSSDVLVDRSSPPLPPASSSPKPQPTPIQRPLTKPGGRSSLLGKTLGPVGTSFRPPLGVRASKPVTVLDDSDDEDPPVHHSSDDEQTQGLKSRFKPTAFKTGERDAAATPSKNETYSTVKESPVSSSQATRPAASSGNTSLFASLMNQYTHKETASAPQRAHAQSNDMASAYGGTTRAPRPQQQPRNSNPIRTATKHVTLDDIEYYDTRNMIFEMQRVMSHESVQRCYDALLKNRMNRYDAMDWLAAHEEPVPSASDDVDELSAMSPQPRRGVAMASKPALSQQLSQPVKSMAKQEVKKPAQSIAERYAQPNQPQRKQSQSTNVVELDDDDEDEDLKPAHRGRLLKGRRPVRSPTPPSSPPAVAAHQKTKQRQKAVVIDNDEEEEEEEEGHSVTGREASEEMQATDVWSEARLLKFFNECSARDLADLSAQPEDVVELVISKRPFNSLDDVRAVSNAPDTKSGKKSKKRAVGEKIVEDCSEMWEGYDAVDELVAECEKIAKPIQQTLKSWGVGDGNGELQLMKLDEAHDSGIGTPASSLSAEDAPVSKKKSKGRFLRQPENMGDVELKDYQLVGLNWLNLLFQKKISCILADDMGLGKTCQVISFLAYLQTQEVDGVHLVIVPGSTLENWLREFQRFAPSMKVVPYYGSQAQRGELQDTINADFSTIDVIVTTYDMCTKPDDNRFLRRLSPSVCVYDEAHQLRNPKSQRYGELVKIPADFKVLLTGTPLQNNLQELVAILAFIMPDLFTEKREQLDFIFKHKATTKDADHAALLSAERIARARTMMTPFILRRKKAQVLDLPAKHSRIEWCDMTDSQAAYYYGLVEEAQQVFAEKAVAKGRAAVGAKKDSSNILMALRQAAIHPLLARRHYDDKKIDKIVALLLKSDEWMGNKPEMVKNYLTSEANTGQNLKGGDYALHKFCEERPFLNKYMLKKEPWMDCAKVQKFKELVTNYAKNDDRVLVFSQFTTLMSILEAVLETLQTKYMRLDGSTKMDMRQDMIDKFNSEPEIPVFMLSTKAGGAGINLASANKVIIFDSGFNPQDDIQAENRAHRVGQTREVEVVRLVTKGTIEEQIHALGESKLALDERVAGEAASAAEAGQAEKQGEQMVEKMFLDSLQRKDEPRTKDDGAKGDLKDAFKAGMESKGVKVASKQAKY
ncbi:hypothetical protein EJ03DRAFT_331548 [Teratosphaeria nubilosa]|uniref:DNA helicase n=1 Tax=Teratosphaeria nubilosa TaxID=161662 RepID=A0A6G1KVZ2_9PEZI|nr:hypothetical protein EJ03DRAFT_331548 [Teratosphaeria nubilosa]